MVIRCKPQASRFHRYLGETIKAVREEEGLTPEQLADACGLEYRTLLDMERGNHCLDLASLEKIAMRLAVSLWRLMARAEERKQGIQ